MLTLTDSPQETLTKNLWEQWKSCGYTTEPHALTWMEINNLAGCFLKICREKQLDHREFDFLNLLDHTLNYEENKSTLYETVGNPYSEEEKEAASKLKDYLTDEKISEYNQKDKNIIEELQQDRQTLNKKLSNLTKKMDEQTLDPEALRHELDEMQKIQSQIYARLEQIPNLDQLVLAMERSQHFKKVGEAIRPLTPNIPPTPPASERKKPKLSAMLHTWFSRKKIKFLDAVAGALTTVIWAASTYGIIETFSLTYVSVIGLAVFWLCYIVVFRLMVDGILG